MKRNLTMLITLLLITTVKAQDSLKLSLQEALKFGLSNNKELQAEGQDLQLNSYKKSELSAALYPTINGNVSATHYLNIPTQYARANNFYPTAPADQYLGLKLLLPNSSNVGLSANWLIYNQAIYSGLKLINAQNESTTIQFQKDRSELAYSISQLYYGIVFAQKQKENLQKIDSNIDKLVNLLQSNYDNGFIKKSELDKVKVNKASMDSQIGELNAAIEAQIKLLKLVLGVPSTNNIKLLESEMESSLSPLAESSSVSPETSFDVQLIQNRIRINKLERKTIMASYMPSLGLAYNYSYNWVSPNFDKIFGSDLKFSQQYIGVNLNVPIFDGNKNLFKLKQNTTTAKQLDLRAQYLSEQISTDITNAQLRYNTSLKNISSNDQNVKLSERLYAQSLLEYQQGTISLNDVLTFENSLQQASTEYFRSVSNALSAMLEYKKTTNTILTK